MVRTRHEFVTQDYRSNMAVAPPAAPDWIELLPTERPFRAPLATPKPLIHSLHTALVTGAEGEEIDCDDHGRILVHFYWDRHNDKSCRVRVSQVWGGQGWGGQVIPRIGMEVMVAFIDGDPDRPIVVGCVPNPQTLKVPYVLPQHKTRMTLKSKTYKGEGFNEVRFEDMTENEEFYMHAQKDMNVKVLNDRNKQIDHDQTERIGNNKTITVGANHSETITKHKTISVVLSHTEKIGADMVIGVGTNRHVNVGKSLNQSVAENKTEFVGKDSAQHVAHVKDTRVGSRYMVDVGEEMHIVVGKAFTIQVGASFFRMNADGTINLSGKNIIKSADEKIELTSRIVKVN